MEAIRTAPRTDGRPDLDVELPGWYQQARCADADGSVFFPEVGETPAPAVAVCRTCPAIDPCREYALADTSLVGVWGGTTPMERKALRRERQAS